MKIAFLRFPFSSQLGGEELHTLNLAKHWRSQGHEIVLYGSCPVLNNIFQEANFFVRPTTLCKPPVSKFELLKFSLLYPFYRKKALKMVQDLKNKNIDLVYCLSLSEKLLLTDLLTKANIKIIWIEHARIGNWLYKNPWRKRYYKLSKSVDLITVSEQMRLALQKQDSNLKAKAIPNGIDLSEMQRQEPEIVDQDTKQATITYIGRLTTDKGAHVLLQALSKLDNKKNWQARIIGTGKELANLEKLAKNLNITDNVKFEKQLDRAAVIKALNLSRVLVLPSIEPDPFGLVIAEGMAAGCETIATKICGCTDYSSEIHIVKPNDSTGLTRAITKILQSQNSQMRRQALISEAARCFDQKNMYNEYDKLIR